jgi:hypothetical protein
MAYREVTMIEITEVLRQGLGGAPETNCAATRARPEDGASVSATACGLAPGMPAAALTEERLTVIVTALQRSPARSYWSGWQTCEVHRAFIEQHARAGVRLSKIRRLLLRQGVTIPAATLYRFATAVLGVGRRAVTVPVADGAPGDEITLDTG